MNQIDVFYLLLLLLKTRLVITEMLSNQQELIVAQTFQRTETNFTGDVIKKNYNGFYSEKESILESNEQLSKDLSYETAWTKTGRRKITIVKVVPTNKSFESDFGSASLQESSFIASVLKTSRSRRELFGKHRRYYIPARSFAQRYPFEVVVKISTGCTGTVVSTRHVLTSAHCLHTGKDFTKGFRSLRVGFLLPNRSIEWINALQVKLPLAWVQGNDTDASRYDYAIIKLVKRHRRRPMPLSYSQGTRFGPSTKIHFTAFEDDKPSNTIWYRSCNIRAATHDMMYHCCDAQPGSSGAGVYVYYFNKRTGERNRLVIGVFSGHRIVPHNPWMPFVGCEPLWRGNFNAAIRFNPLKFKQLCHWIGIKHAVRDCKRYLMSLPSHEPPRSPLRHPGGSSKKPDKRRKKQRRASRKKSRSNARKLKRKERKKQRRLKKKKRRQLKKRRKKYPKGSFTL